MHVSDLVAAMESIAPVHLAGEWDNVGLLVGDPTDELDGSVVVTIDLTPTVVDEALAAGAGAVIAYHPPMFRPINRLVADAPRARALLKLIRAGVAIYSPHSALDAVPGGMGDWLLERCAYADELSDRRAIEPASSYRSGGSHKVVVFVPEVEAARVRDAMADAGAGVIGAYDRCTFELMGTGTFRGGDGTNPAVGEMGRLERAPEVRLEMVCSRAALAGVVNALRDEHPYEEPAFDVYPLEPVADPGVGAGRIATLGAETDAVAVATRVARELGVPSVKLADAGRPIRRLACCPGAGGSLGAGAASLGAECFVTGEMSHHDVLGALDRGVSVVLAGHTNTERGYLPVLADRVREHLAGASVVVSTSDAAPMSPITG
ncbi:MAG: Nif3-like dinuclear metal center hexameric protein [Planctomycetota bacterium]